MDQARAALERAKGRQADAAAAIAAAAALKGTADAEVAQFQKEVKELESQLLVTEPPATASTVRPMDQVQTLLRTMLDQLTDDPFVPSEQVQCARTHVQQLVQGFADTLAEARRAQRAQADAVKGAPTTRREGKQPLVPPSVSTVTGVRLAGKQPPKRLITDHFKVIKRVVKVAKTEDSPMPALG